MFNCYVFLALLEGSCLYQGYLACTFIYKAGQIAYRPKPTLVKGLIRRDYKPPSKLDKVSSNLKSRYHQLQCSK